MNIAELIDALSTVPPWKRHLPAYVSVSEDCDHMLATSVCLYDEADAHSEDNPLGIHFQGGEERAVNPKPLQMRPPMRRENNTVKKLDVLTTAADLLADEPGQNGEYDNAVVQMVAVLLGISTQDDDLAALELVLRAVK